MMWTGASAKFLGSTPPDEQVGSSFDSDTSNEWSTTAVIGATPQRKSSLSWEEAVTTLHRNSLSNSFKRPSISSASVDEEPADDKEDHVVSQVNRLLEDEDVDFGAGRNSIVTEECLFELDDLNLDNAGLLPSLGDFQLSHNYYQAASGFAEETLEKDKKTSCRFYQQGHCKSGDYCKFSHELEGLQSPPLSSQLYPVEVTSPKSAARSKSRSNSLNSNSSSSTSSKYCKFFSQGFCRNGDNCPFLHQDEVMETPPLVPLSPNFDPQDFEMSPILSAKRSPPESPLMTHILPPQQLQQQQFNTGNGTQICPFFMKGDCKFGDRCRNVHQAKEKARKPITEESLRKFSQIPCKYFNYGQGVCPFGDACYYLHTTMLPQQQTFLSHMMNRNTTH